MLKVKKYAQSMVILLIAVLTVFSGINVSAVSYNEYSSAEPYYNYEYNGYGELTSAPASYTPYSNLALADLGIDTAESDFTDLFFDGNNLYVLDGGRGQIIVLDSEYRLVNTISELTSEPSLGDIDTTFVGANGLFVTSDRQILICDTERERVLVVEDGKIVNLISRPDTTSLSDNIKFDVKKIVKTGANYYVTAESVTSGVMVFNERFEFVRFFGSNQVTVTAEVLLQAFQSLYMSDEQIAARRKFIASRVTGLDVDDHGFIVVVSSDPELTVSGSAVRCLNYKGSDVIPDEKDTFGDREITKSDANTFTDVCVDQDGFYVLLDTAYGRIFQYSEKGVMVGAFGGIGTALGMFDNPVALETVNQDIAVLDSTRATITVFKPTDYCVVKRELLSIIDSGNTDRIEALSEKILKYNTNSQYAYYVKGFVAESRGDYKAAMEFYKEANDRDSYAQAFKLWRTAFIKEHFVLVMLAIILVFAVIVCVMILIGKGLKKSEQSVFVPLECKAGFPIYCLFHPADGFDQIKRRRVLSPVWLISIIAAFVYITINRYFSVGFIHNTNRASEFNILIILAKTIGLIAMFVIANWAICTLMEGKGKPKEIIYTVVYSLLPYVLALIITLPLSNMLTADESVMMSIIMTFAAVWTGLVLFVGLLTIHEYSVGKNIAAMLLTVVGMAIIMLLIILFYTLMAQTGSFVQSIIQEYTLRH